MGTRVVRGLDWRWSVQDGYTVGKIVQGLGHHRHNGWVRVLWDNGYENSYRTGRNGHYDITVIGESVK